MGGRVDALKSQEVPNNSLIAQAFRVCRASVPWENENLPCFLGVLRKNRLTTQSPAAYDTADPSCMQRHRTMASIILLRGHSYETE